jgi:hypothetical protein
MLEDDVYAKAKQIAENSGRSLGEVFLSLRERASRLNHRSTSKTAYRCFGWEILQSEFLETEQRRSSAALHKAKVATFDTRVQAITAPETVELINR